jgi:hypothetical protein
MLGFESIARTAAEAIFALSGKNFYKAY